MHRCLPSRSSQAMQTAQFQLHAEIEQRHWWFVARRRIVRKLIGSVLPPNPETTLIDVGCGTGANLAALADDYRCVGIDTSAEAIELARRRFLRVTFLDGFAPRDVPAEILKDARLVLMTDVLEHVPDDYALLSELLAAVQPGTYFLLTVPADPALWSPHDESFGHYRRYRLTDFQSLWAGLPVDTHMVSYFNARLRPVIKSVRWWNRFRRQSAGAAGTDFSLPSGPVNRLLSAVFGGGRAAGRPGGRPRPVSGTDAASAWWRLSSAAVPAPFRPAANRRTPFRICSIP